MPITNGGSVATTEQTTRHRAVDEPAGAQRGDDAGAGADHDGQDQRQRGDREVDGQRLLDGVGDRDRGEPRPAQVAVERVGRAR